MADKVVALDEVVAVRSGNAWKSSRFSKTVDGLPVIRIQNVGLTESDYVYWPDEYDEKFIVEKGDLLLTLSGSFRAAIWDGPRGLLNQRVIKLTPTAKLDSTFFYRWLETQLVGIENLGRHALVNNVSVTDIKSMQIPLPPLPEQRRIAAILDKADALRQKRREAIAKLDQLLQSVFLEMFGDLEPDSDFVEDLANAAKGSMRTGPFGSQLLHREFVESGISVLGIDNAVQNEFRWAASRFITEKKFDSLRRFQVWPGDVLITIMGTCGRCAVVPDNVPKAINTKHLCCITLDQKSVCRNSCTRIF